MSIRIAFAFTGSELDIQKPDENNLSCIAWYNSIRGTGRITAKPVIYGYLSKDKITFFSDQSLNPVTTPLKKEMINTVLYYYRQYFRGEPVIYNGSFRTNLA